jgi:hypothetical protein
VRKAWGVIALVAVSIILIKLAINVVTPLLPIILTIFAIVIAALIGWLIFRLILRRKRFF